MSKFRSQPRLASLALLLVSLLVLNNSYALEILTHQGHGHDATLVQEQTAHDPHDISSMHSNSMHDSHSAQSDSDAQSSTDEDCFCDEICCVSSTDFGNAPSSAQTAHQSDASKVIPDNYQSIFLDLFLPPPTA